MLMFMGFLMNAQNQKVLSSTTPLQNDDEITVLKNNFNNVSAQVKNLHDKVNNKSNEDKKKIEALVDEVKGMNDKVNRSYALSNQMNENLSKSIL